MMRPQKNILAVALFFGVKNFFALFFLITILSLSSNSNAQDCTSLGQTPSTSFPVCGSSVFNQNSVPTCGTKVIISACNTGTTYLDKNPFWYKFKSYTTGTLGFVIKPIDPNSDYDWQLFDITNKNPADVYTDISMFIACNWSGEVGETGASAAGVSLVNCDGFGIPPFSSMPTLIKDHEYLLLVSHFTNSQSGYSLSFEGGTAEIVDPEEPELASASASCSGNNIKVAINKKIKCSSLDANGMVFSLQPPAAAIISATGKDCNSGFDSDTIVLDLNNNLPPGDYTLTINNGPDGNTLLDNCERSIPSGDILPFNVAAPTPPSLTKINMKDCAPNFIEVELSKPVACNSIETNGSDFDISGSYPVSISKVASNCTADYTSTIRIELTTSLQKKGTFTIKVKKGTDGNTLLDNCTQELPAESSLSFNVYDTVNADFTFSLSRGCEEDTVNYFHEGKNEVNSWIWKFNDQPQSNQQNPTILYKIAGLKETELIVSNGACSDTEKVIIYSKELFKPDFETINSVCPGDKIPFKDKSQGDIINWFWDFGNGNEFNGKNPPEQIYTTAASNYTVPVKLIVTNTSGCKDSTIYILDVVANCYIAVPSTFTPNNDGLNDFLYPLNAYKARNLKFIVYNRYGQMVFYTEDWTKKWNGKYKGKPADGGVYIWLLSYTDINNNKVETKGTVLLIK